MIARPERRVLTYGTFDGFTHGDVQRLRQLAGLGDRLIVGVASDAYLARRGQPPGLAFAERADVVAACRYVDRVIPLNHADQPRIDVVNHNVALLAVDGHHAVAAPDLDLLTEVLLLPQSTSATGAHLSAVA